MPFTEPQCDAMDARRDEQKETARHSKRMAIPVIAEQSVSLFRLWNAAVLAPGCGTVYVHESGSPGAAEALRAWASAHGYAVEDQIYLTDHGNYRSLGVTVRACNISVLRYRDATEEEIAANTTNTSKDSSK